MDREVEIPTQVAKKKWSKAGFSVAAKYWVMSYEVTVGFLSGVSISVSLWSYQRMPGALSCRCCTISGNGAVPDSEWCPPIKMARILIFSFENWSRREARFG
jgi:hypothetical protein